MRNSVLAAMVIGLMAGPALVAVGQEAAGQVRPQFTPLAIEETRGARQVETPLSQSVAKPPLRLTPKSEAGRQSLSRPAAVSPGRALGTVAGSLGIVLGMFFVLAWCLARVGPKASLRLPKEAVELVGQAPLVGRQQMQLVRVGNRLLLLAIGAGGAETLAEIREPAEVEHLLTLCRRGATGSASATFREALEDLAAGRDEAPRARSATAGMRGGR